MLAQPCDYVNRGGARAPRAVARAMPPNAPAPALGPESKRRLHVVGRRRWGQKSQAQAARSKTGLNLYPYTKVPFSPSACSLRVTISTGIPIRRGVPSRSVT